jgi:hypothetical protein
LSFKIAPPVRGAKRSEKKEGSRHVEREVREK